MHTFTRRGIAVAAALIVTATAAQTAHADPTPVATSAIDARTLAVMVAQQPLTAAVQRIEAAEGPTDQGFAGTAIDIAHHTVTVHWHGTVPAAVTAEIDRARAQGITVTVQPAAYSRAQLDAEMNRLADRSTAEANQRHTKPLIASVRVRADYSGLDIGVTTDPAAALSPLAAGTADLAGSIPVSTHHEDLMVPMSTRQADSSPYSGGAAIKSATTGGACSTGWAVHDSSRSYVLSAAHCGWDTWRTYSGTYTLGRTTSISYSYDAQLIPATSTGRIYIGTSIADTSGAGQSFRQVVGVLPLAYGTELCTDGAMSGIQCSSITVTSQGRVVDEIVEADGTVKNVSVWEAKSGTRNTIAGSGDSGGPVFGVTGPGGSEILAAGTIAGGVGATSVKCNGVQNRECSYAIAFGAVSDELTALGVQLS